ncbi:MAG: 1-deoxy-D-xylulose-5-phosphate reductoisomerase, partial [Clostridia bacterium]|nr:1-deoxy-D-xylulose-5-phosphate reductoisomerase [Clostridia bacterium]
MNINEKYIAVLGSTGSIGRQALDVCEKQSVRVEALSANKSIDLLEKQIRKFRPKFAAMKDEQSARILKERIVDTSTVVFAGEEGILDMINLLEGDTVLNSIIGGDGLLPTYESVRCAKNLALANKESLVTAGDIIMKKAERKGVKIMPVDSEHCAIFQCLMSGAHSEVKRIILTASGGPFFGRKRDELVAVGVSEALAHPTWNMGRKITVDSATMMNKCFEMIEAKHLFGVDPSQIDVVIHRQSVVHSMVEFADSAIIAQLAVPDMRMCIQYALTWPERMPGQTPSLDFAKGL